MSDGVDRDRARALGLCRVAYADLVRARSTYEEAMLAAADLGVTFAQLSRELKVSEPAIRGFIRRAQRRRAREH